MRGEGDAVGAAAYGEGLEGLWAGWRPLGDVGCERCLLGRGYCGLVAGRGLTILTVPSHELETKVSFVVWFQNTENVSLLCS